MERSLYRQHIRLCVALFLVSLNLLLNAQDWKLVWEDEFDGTSLDPSTWTFESGLTNDNLHYYTDRPGNARIEDGILKIIALKEAYQGAEYTSALVKTERALNWRYGRIEALIKLPGTPGFVPAFWMLPADNLYGWWPLSGEIDIMEHPTNSESSIYGTVHTEYYNLFSGSSPPQGGMVDISDAETAFHLYAVEWTGEQIDFFVDEQKYFTFSRDNGEPDKWPFNESFYIILNLAVGGGWVGEPDENTEFPAVMEVDYVRVYQHENDAVILGADFVTYNSEDVSYKLPGFEGAAYHWKVPGDAQILSGQGSAQLKMNWGLFGGNIEAEIVTDEGSFLKSHPVRVSPNFLKNQGFEKGVKYWNIRTGYPVAADFTLVSGGVHPGGKSLFVEVSEPTVNAWDFQLSQGDLQVQAGKPYHVSFRAKSADPLGSITAAIINTSNFGLIANVSFLPNETWTLHEFDFTPSSTVPVALNIDLGEYTGSCYFDDFVLTTAELSELNLLVNPDFFDGAIQWNLTTHSTAQASGTADNGVYRVTITEGGENAWDIHLGQPGLLIENGEKYTVSFSARADTPRLISALVGRNSEPWTLYSGSLDFSLTTTWQNFSYSFTMNDPTDPQSRLGFDVGGNPGEVFFDNVLLKKAEADPVSVTLTADRLSEHGLRTQPNPFDVQTTIYYILPESSAVTLKIFNLYGQEIETLVHEFQQSGEHEVTWKAADHPAGTYVYLIQSGGKSETGKLVIHR